MRTPTHILPFTGANLMGNNPGITDRQIRSALDAQRAKLDRQEQACEATRAMIAILEGQLSQTAAKTAQHKS